MRNQVTFAIVLSRINYSESDRIVNVITKDDGKLTLMAKGSRKIKSKLAAGIELLSVNEIVFIKGKSDISTLVSSRPIEFFSEISKDLNRINVAYKYLQIIDKNTEDNADEDYFELLKDSLIFLNSSENDSDQCYQYFLSKLINISGFSPNLITDSNSNKLDQDKKYNFDVSEMNFTESSNGKFNVKSIKYLRLLFSNSPESVFKISDELDSKLINNLLESIFKRYLSL